MKSLNAAFDEKLESDSEQMDAGARVIRPLLFTGFMENLDKSWNFKKWLFQGLENGREKIKSQKIWKSHLHLHSLIKRINIYVNIYSFNQTIVSHSFVSYKVYRYTHIYMEISQHFWTWKFAFKV